MTAEDRETLIRFLSTQWLPPDVKEAFDRFQAEHTASQPCLTLRVGHTFLDATGTDRCKATVEVR